MWDDSWDNGHSPVIGVDQDQAVDYLLLCNPYKRLCMLNNQEIYDGMWAGVFLWFMYGALFWY